LRKLRRVTEATAMTFTVEFDKTHTAFPDVTVSLDLLSEQLEDGRWKLTKYGELQLVEP